MKLYYTVQVAIFDSSITSLIGFCMWRLDNKQRALYCWRYFIVSEKMLRRMSHNFNKWFSSVVMHLQCLRGHNFLLEHPICFEQMPKMPNFLIFTELLAKLGSTVLPICDNHLITIDHRILIRCNTFLQASRASSHDVTTNKK